MILFLSRPYDSGPSTDVYDPVFENNEWAAIIEACHANEVPDTWVADGTCYKDMLINGTNYRIDIIGKNHDDLSDGTGKAPLTFQLHDCYDTVFRMNPTITNVGGWRDCQMRTKTMPELKALMPAEVQAGIRPVNKLTSAGGQSSSIVTTSDELFLPSEVEVFGSITNSFSGEGTQYEYYQAGNSKVKNRKGSAYHWWERSPLFDGSSSYCRVTSNGTVGFNTAQMAYGVPFCFCF